MFRSELHTEFPIIKIDACRRTANVHEFLRFAGSSFSTQRKRRRGSGVESGGEGDQEGRREEKGIRRGGESGGILSKSLVKP